jgi:isopentenyl diphosphate isomerase/L-lactate dehydrogenase-like FMN-dependent dehydrogenase
MTGGRQVDGAIPSLFALEKIMESPRVKSAVESGKFTVLFDSGIRTGPDIFKAIALGAQGVLRMCITFLLRLTEMRSQWAALGFTVRLLQGRLESSRSSGKLSRN